MRFEKFDLNLLVMLDALLEERNVSRVAVRLHVTQPAVSNALANLRRHFGDPLLTRTGRQFTLTPLGAELRAPLQHTLMSIRGVTTARGLFDPLTSTAQLRIAASDWFAVTHVTALVQRLAQIAPRMRLEHRPIGPAACDRMIAGTIELLVMRGERLLYDHPAEFLGPDPAAVIGCARHAPFASQVLTLADVQCFSQVLALDDDGEPLMPQLHRQAARENVAAMTSSVSLLPEIVVNTHHVAIVPAVAAQHYARHHPIKVALLSDVEPTRIHLQWHRHRHTEPILTWFREQIGAIHAELSV